MGGRLILVAALLTALAGCEETVAPQLTLAGEADAAGADALGAVDAAADGGFDAAGEDANPADGAGQDGAADLGEADADPADLGSDTAADLDSAAEDSSDAAPVDGAGSEILADGGDSYGEVEPGDASAIDSAANDSTANDSGATTPAPALGPLSPCDSDSDCTGPAASGGRCLVAAHVCVPCLSAKDCPASASCQGFQCQPTAVCQAKGDCPAQCDSTKGQCVQCLADADCPKGATCAQGGCLAALCSATVCGGAKIYACLGPTLGYGAGLSCDDGDPCTQGDSCSAGKCKPGAPNACDDANPCTDDSCDAASGCLHAPVQGGCDDGDPCTSQDNCAGGTCQGLAKACDDGQDCTKDFCLGGNCLASAADGPCSDGNPCTQQDFCKNGKCTAGSLGCDDDNPCTDDSCGASACVFVPKLGACDDGNACTLGDICLNGQCTGVPQVCIDANPCTDDGCVGGGCLFSPNSKPCNDNDVCTLNDVCSGGSCSGSDKSCDDGNPCTADACLSTGCAHQNKPGPCDDGNGCTQNDACQGASCVGVAKSCDDGSPCTQDKCEGGSCVFSPVDGGACGNGCSVCKGGQCLQDPNTPLDDSYGSAAADALRVVLPAPGGGWLLAGKNPGKSSNGYDDGWVVRVDAKGNVQWEKSFGGLYHDILRRGVVTADGLYALVGTWHGPNVNQQLWLLVLDDSGTVKLDVQIGNQAAEIGLDLAVNASGFLLAGQRPTPGVGNTGYLVQTDSKGSILWEKTYPNVSELAAVVALGEQIAVAGPGPKAEAGIDAVVMRLKPGGSTLWTSYVGSAYNDIVADLRVSSDGDLLLSGAQGGQGGNRAMAARIAAADGKVAWQKTAASPAGSTSVGHAGLQNGAQLVVVGQISSNNQSDGLLWALSPLDGATLWQRAAPGPVSGSEALWGLHPRPAGGLAVVGERPVPQANQDGWLLLLSAEGKLGCDCEGSCSDGNACTGDTCMLGVCKGSPIAKGTVCVDASKLPGKCDGYGACTGVCGNKICEAGETASNCASDCK